MIMLSIIDPTPTPASLAAESYSDCPAKIVLIVIIKKLPTVVIIDGHMSLMKLIVISHRLGYKYFFMSIGCTWMLNELRSKLVSSSVCF